MISPFSLSIVIVTHNSAVALHALLPRLDLDAELIVSDNASSDNVADLLRGRPARLLRNEGNIGYGAACNRAAAIATGEYLLFMNPDVEVTAATFAELKAAAARYPDAAVFVPRIEDRHGKPLVRDHNFVERLQRDAWLRHPRRNVGDCCIHAIHGAMFMVRKSAFLAVGGFDEKIFLYYEDDDLAYRFTLLKQPIVYVDAALAIHGEQESSETSVGRQVRMGFHKKRSEIYMRRKYGLGYGAGRDMIRNLANVLFYLATFRFRRLFSALGRVRGIWSNP